MKSQVRFNREQDKGEQTVHASRVAVLLMLSKNEDFYTSGLGVRSWWGKTLSLTVVRGGGGKEAQSLSRHVFSCCVGDIIALSGVAPQGAEAVI